MFAWKYVTFLFLLVSLRKICYFFTLLHKMCHFLYFCVKMCHYHVHCLAVSFQHQLQSCHFIAPSCHLLCKGNHATFWHDWPRVMPLSRQSCVMPLLCYSLPFLCAEVAEGRPTNIGRLCSTVQACRLQATERTCSRVYVTTCCCLTTK